MSLITGDQFFAHLVGDFLLQSDYMALNKKDRILPCLIHVLLYTVPFLFLTRSPLALLVIMGTHFAIDHWGPHRHFIWAKNQLFAPKAARKTWDECRFTGFSPDRPVWLSVWLSIVVDNTAHLIINGLAIRFF